MKGSSERGGAVNRDRGAVAAADPTPRRWDSLDVLAFVAGAVVGAVAGMAVGEAIDGDGADLGTIGALVIGIVALVLRRRHLPAEPSAIQGRPAVLTAALGLVGVGALVAAVGGYWTLGLVGPRLRAQPLSELMKGTWWELPAVFVGAGVVMVAVGALLERWLERRARERAR